MRDTNMGFIEHLDETKQLVKNGMQGGFCGKTRENDFTGQDSQKDTARN